MDAPTFRAFYHFLLDPDSKGWEPWRVLDRTLLLEWAAQLAPTMQSLAPFASAAARQLQGEEILEGLWELYALSRVNDLLLLPFQPVAPSEHEREQPVTPITLDDYLTFWEHLGLRRYLPRAFHPFFCEIVAVEPADDPEAPAQLREIHWPALFLGDLLISRAGVSVVAGANHLNADIAPRSTLSFTHRRRARPSRDLSRDWGHNSQWRTAFRRDYCDGDILYYNVDGKIDVWARSPADDINFMSRDLLSPRERYELLVHRCFVLTTSHPEEALIYDETLVEPALHEDKPWQMPPLSERDEDPGRHTRWNWFFEPQPPPPGAPPLMGKISPGRFFRLLERLGRRYAAECWLCGSHDSAVGQRNGTLHFPVSPEVLLLELLALAPDGWIYLLRPGFHWKELDQLATFEAQPIPDELVEVYVDDREPIIDLLTCTVGAPEELEPNHVWLSPLTPGREAKLLLPGGQPVEGREPEDLAILARLYPEVRELARAEGDLAGEVDATLRLGAVRVMLGEIAAGVALLDEALALAEQLGDQRRLAAALGERGLAQAATRVHEP